MKKLLSVLLVVLTLVSAMSVTSSAAPKYKNGDVLFEQDFSDLAAIQALPDYSMHGYASKLANTVVEIQDGKLHLKSPDVDAQEKTIGGRYGTRLSLYKIPEDVKYFSIQLDLTLNEFVGGASSSTGPSLIMADNRLTDAALGDKDSIFSMIWMRESSKGTSGSYTYGGSSNKVKKGLTGICDAACDYTIKVYVDLETSTGHFSIMNNTLQVSYEETEFLYNTGAVDQFIGVASNGTDVSFDKLTVYWGDGVFNLYDPVDEDAEAETEAPATTKAPDDAKDPEATDKADDDAKEEGGNNTTLIVGIVAAVVVVAAVVAVVIAKKKKK